MKRPKDMTTEELMALPEYSPFSYHEVVLETQAQVVWASKKYKGLYKLGDSIRIPIVRKASCVQMQKDDIAVFWDQEGNGWFPRWDGEKWCKERAWL